MSNKINLTEKIFDLFRNHDDYYLNTEQLLLKFKKTSTLQQIKYEIENNLKKKLGFIDQDEDPEKINDFLNKIENHIKNAELKFYYKDSPKQTKQKTFCDELNLKNSVNNLEYIKKNHSDIEITWKTCREYLGQENVVILPEKINFRNFNQGEIRDCYFIACVSALAQIPQLLYFIMGLTDKEVQNENPDYFMVKFFIDGNWTKIIVEDSFPCFSKNNSNFKLVGAEPDNNELFMMILEKAWAQINGGYDQIELGDIKNIFELFLGCKCDYFQNDDNISNIEYLFNKVKENEKNFGAFSLCGSQFYDYYIPKHKELIKNFNKEHSLEKNDIKKVGYHAYNILKTLEMRIKENKLNKNKNDIFKVFIIENPHGKLSNLISSGIELNEIEKILKENFGSENKSQYEFILKKNEKYGFLLDENNKIINSPERTGIIFMPLEYFQKWQYCTSVCNPHYGCFSYTFDIKNELGCLYIFKIKINKKQLFTCQVCFPNYRVHKHEIKKIRIKCELKDELMVQKKILLYYMFCGIKIIKNNETLDIIKNYENYYSRDENDLSSIKEVNTSLEKGEYFVMIYPEYPESLLNPCPCVLRFLSEKDIKVSLIDKIDKDKFNDKNIYYSTYDDIFWKIFYKDNSNYYKQFLNPENKEIFEIQPKIFLPGIKEYYSHFKTLFDNKYKELNPESSEFKELNPEDAIYKINKKGEAYYYDIIEPYSLNKIFKGRIKNGKAKYDFIQLNNLQFIDNLGLPYQVNNLEELIKEMKMNQNPVNCLLSEFDENTKVLNSYVTHIKIFENKANNEDILVVTDKSGKNLKRNQQPLFIIILDISGSMQEYHNYLQNNIIPKLLTKLGYKNENEDLIKIIKENNLTSFEILQAITCKYKFDSFLERYKFDKQLKPKYFKNYCDNIIPLITFSDISELHFFCVSEFENCYLSGGSTYFKNAAEYLKMMLNSVSRERSIRLLTFSDGYIYDKYDSMQILDQILNSRKDRHQMNSVSVRVGHNTVPDTEVLMKLSSFSHPISDMTQVIIDKDIEKDENEVVDKLYNRFINDGMIYNLKLISNIAMMSEEFSDNFVKVQPLSKNCTILRINAHKSINEYKESLKISSGKIEFEDCGELKEDDFYNMMTHNGPLMAQRILEKRVNKNEKSLKENQEIINYLKKTEEYFENQKIKENDLNKNNSNQKDQKIRTKKIYEYFRKIDDDKEIEKVDENILHELIAEVRDKTKEIIEINNNVDKSEKNIDNINIDKIINNTKDIINKKKLIKKTVEITTTITYTFENGAKKVITQNQIYDYDN